MKLTLCAITACFFLSFNQSSQEKYLFWKPGLELKWTDFRGHIRSEDEGVASASYIGFFHKVKKCVHPDSIRLDTRAFFNKSSSWVKVPSVSPDLLSHEQLHFDLAELSARKFRRAMLLAKVNFETIIRCVDSTYKYYSAQGDSIHIQYDIETNHGLNRTEQFKWDGKIKDELLRSVAYGSYSIKVYIGK